MRLRRALAVLASAAASALAAGAMPASPASAAPHVIHPDGTTFTGLTLSASTIFFGSEQIEVASFTVSNISGPAIGGTVTVFAGNTSVCSGPVTPFQGSITLSAGSCTFPSSRLVTGPWQVAASYSGDQNGNFASSSAIKSLTVSPGLTSSALELSSPDATFGGEHMIGLFVTVTQASGSVVPTGGFRITDENGRLLCSGALDGSGTAACALGDNTLHAGDHDLTVTYLGDSNYQGSASPAHDFFVFKAGSTTTESLPATTLAFDQQGGLLVNYQVTSSAGVTPTGSAAVTTGTGQPICTGQLSNGAGNCPIPDQALPPGNYQLTATYSGDGDNAVSASTSQALTITQEPTATAVTLSAAKATFGHEQAERISTQVRPRTSGIPTGQVTIKAGSAVVCRATLAAGKATCSPGATRLRPGTYHLTASYGGDSIFAASSGHATITVAPEPTSTSLALSPTAVRSGHEQAERLTVRVKPAFGGTPAGAVTVKAGPVTVCTISLKGGKGTCTLGASKLRPGTYKLVARYGGRSPYAASASAKRTLTVTR
jgi:Big-like domain-containing protein